MEQILFDCDNTMGIEGRPMDDALALLYLLGRTEEARVLGVACNCGNGTAAEVYSCCQRLMAETKMTIPLYRGPERGEDPRGESARFIAERAAAAPGQVSYLGLGSLTNLYGAWLLDPDVFDNLKQIVLMGGITQRLHIHGKDLDELNFSTDPRASACVLRRGRNISVITGNSCLPVSYLPRDEFMPRMCLMDNPAGMYIAQKCGYRFEDKKAIYGADGSYCWDAVAAVYLLHPELFEDAPTRCAITEEDLSWGYLAPAPEGEQVLNLPRARDRVLFQEELYRGWLALKMDGAGGGAACKGSFFDKLLQPAILLELSREPCHGFALLQRLREDGLIGELDPAGMYRTLKRMERAGELTSSCQKVSARARPRRVFQVTELGRYSLSNWESSLEQYQRHIDQLLRALRARREEDGAE